MDRTLDGAAVQAAYDPLTSNSASIPERSSASSHELTANRRLDGREQDAEECEQSQIPLAEVDELLAIEIWTPGVPQYCKAVADHYGVSRRTVQKWFQRLLKLCPWLTEAELQLSDDRYTPLAIKLMGECYLSKSAKQWAEQVADRFARSVMPQNCSTVALTVSSAPTEPSQAVVEGELVDSEGLLHTLATHRSTTQQALTLTQQQTQALSEKNSRQLQHLQQLLQERQRQQQEAQHQKQAQWDSEVTRETLDEFLYKQQRREELLAELEQLRRMGKPSAAAPPAG